MATKTPTVRDDVDSTIRAGLTLMRARMEDGSISTIELIATVTKLMSEATARDALVTETDDDE